MSRFPVEQLPARLKSIDMSGAEVTHIADWATMSEPARLRLLRNIIQMSGRDPRLSALAVDIFKKAGVQPRDYVGQAAAILKWVQDPKHVFYLNESAERIQTAVVTLKYGFGDCDDSTVLICSLFEAIRLPWKLVLAGTQGKGKNQKRVRFIEGSRFPLGCKWVHIFCMVGTPPFKPKRWYFCETTIQGVPLGWDIIDGDKRYLPEMDAPLPGPALVVPAPKAPFGFRPSPLPPPANRSPAYGLARGFDLLPAPAPVAPTTQTQLSNYGASALSPVGAYVSSSIAADVEEGLSSNGSSSVKKKLLDWEKMLPGIVTGVAVAVSVQLILDYVRPKLNMNKGKNKISD